MKKTIEGKRYDSENCETLGETDTYQNGNIIGTTYLLIATNDEILILLNSFCFI